MPTGLWMPACPSTTYSRRSRWMMRWSWGRGIARAAAMARAAARWLTSSLSMRATPWLFSPFTWSPETETLTLWIWLPAMRSASVSAAMMAAAVFSTSLTRPARIPRDALVPMPRIERPVAVRSPTSSVTFWVPTSSAAMGRFLATPGRLLLDRIRRSPASRRARGSRRAGGLRSFDGVPLREDLFGVGREHRRQLVVDAADHDAAGVVGVDHARAVGQRAELGERDREAVEAGRRVLGLAEPHRSLDAARVEPDAAAVVHVKLGDFDLPRGGFAEHAEKLAQAPGIFGLR